MIKLTLCEVEPDSFSNGSTIVAAFQVGRIYDGGACAIGFATSTNNGATWTSGLLPGITKWTPQRGTNDRATDASVAYDAEHNVWLISSLTLLEAGGVHGNACRHQPLDRRRPTWGTPVTTATGGDLDKNWIVCDNTADQPLLRPLLHRVGRPRHRQPAADEHLHRRRPDLAAPRPTAPASSAASRSSARTEPSSCPTDNANETALGAFNSTNGGARGAP